MPSNPSTSILIVDDDPTNLRALAAILQKEGFSVLQASRGVQGRQIARQHLPDLIMLDRQMPEEDGLETCRKLKDDPRTCSIPIIFVSMDGDVDVKVSAFGAGAVDYITKPFAPAEVRARVHLHLRMSHGIKALIETQAARLHELAAAQQAMFVQPSDYPDAGFAVWRKPRHEVGGDFYDILPIAPGIWDYVIADVAGHDLASSLATAALKVLLRENVGLLCLPHEMINLVNAVMHRVYPEGPFVTMAYARLNRARRVLTTAFAGHPPVIHASSTGSGWLISDQSEMIGAFPNIALTPQTISVTAGDRILFYTDGLIELPSSGPPAPRAQQIQQLLELSIRYRQFPLADAMSRMVHDIVPDGDADDDLLLMGVQV
jgi:phosphoserine phosphatase RsbU/P